MKALICKIFGHGLKVTTKRKEDAPAERQLFQNPFDFIVQTGTCPRCNKILWVNN